MSLKDKMEQEIMEDISFNLRDASEIMKMITSGKCDSTFVQLYYQDKVNRELDTMASSFRRSAEICLADEWVGEDESELNYYVMYKMLECFNKSDKENHTIRKFLNTYFNGIIIKLREDCKKDEEEMDS